MQKKLGIPVSSLLLVTFMVILSHYLKDSFIENATRKKCGYEALKGQMEPPFILPLS